jgi:hypothetical protein
MKRQRRFKVSFWVRESYYIEVAAASESAAIAKVERLYFKAGDDAAKGFEIEDGGAEMWEADEVAP